MHVALVIGRIDGVKSLPFVEHAQRADGQGLRLPALEETRPVHARQIPRHDVQRPDLVGGAAICAFARLDDHLAHGALLERLQSSSDIAAPREALLVGELLLGDGLLQQVDLAHT